MTERGRRELVFEFPLGARKPQPVVGDVSCDHIPCEARVEVSYLKDSGRWAADVTVWCTKCKVPFRFLGLPGGLSFSRPTVAINGQELHLPIEPAHVEGLVGIDI